jgi:hypothetical protein
MRYAAAMMDFWTTATQGPSSVLATLMFPACSVVGTQKPVFGAEYCDATAAGNGVTQDPGCYCPEAIASGRNVLIKTTNLDDKVCAESAWPMGRLFCQGHC